jgi:uncharacterized peroxidase-related enzyme
MIAKTFTPQNGVKVFAIMKTRLPVRIAAAPPSAQPRQRSAPGPGGARHPAPRPRPAYAESVPHITLNSDAPGIRGLLQYRPEIARPLGELTDVLLRGPSTLTRGERELIAAYVSSLNECRYCTSSHSAAAAAQLPGGMEVVEQVRADAETAPVSAKLRTLLAIAASVQRSGRDVTEAQVAAARAEGATDLEIHDTVLIAAAFAMMNRYVDGLATIAPDDPARYAAGAQQLIARGYVLPAAADT